MSRPTARRLAVLVTAAGCLATAAMPAIAQSASEPTTVSYVVADGTRQFRVTELDGTTPLADFTFGSALQKPFRTLVNDENRLLNSEGYHINAQMTNLYLRTATGYDYTSIIPSKNLSLTYGANPLAGTSTLPVVPRVSLAGTIGTCVDAGVAAALGIPPLDPVLGLLDPAFSLLSPLLQTVCTELDALTTAARTVDATVDGALKSVTAPLALPDLPFSLTGAQQAGAFTNPSFQGLIAAGDSAKTGAPAATTKRIMTGTPLVPTGDLTGLLAGLTTTLTSALGSAPLVAGDNSGVTTLTSALAAISGGNSALVSTISKLTATDQLDLINLLTDALLPVDLTALTSVTGQYGAFPVLQASPLGVKQGTYAGTLIVDFFETAN